MRVLACRLAAAFTLTALLACSGLGVCWKQFARMTHHCCPGGDTKTAQIKPCASVVAHEAAVVMPPPAVAMLLVPVESSGLDEVPLAMDPLARAKGPPLILRI